MKNTAFYGKTQNAKELFAMPHVNGGLIGGASLDVGKFTSIMESAK